MHEPKLDSIREHVADRFQELADIDTHFRLNTAAAIEDLISQTSPGWDIARATAALVLTDSTDGYWARTAKIVRGYDKPTEGAAKDPEADHLTVKAIIDGLSFRARIRNENHTAVWLSQLSHRSDTRNNRMDENRATIASHPDLDQRELRASTLNKAKMVCQVIGGVALTSPLYDKKLPRVAGIGFIQFGTWLGEVGEKKFRKKVNKLIASESVEPTCPKPKHLKNR